MHHYKSQDIDQILNSDAFDACVGKNHSVGGHLDSLAPAIISQKTYQG